MIDGVSHVTSGLIHTKQGQNIENTWVYFPTTIGNDAYNHLGPRLAGQADVAAENSPSSTPQRPMYASFYACIGAQYCA